MDFALLGFIMNAVQVVRIIRFGNSYMKLMNAAGIIACAAALMFAPLNQQANAQCLADVNHDHSVDGTDLTVILSTWGTNGGSVGGDTNGDGIVNGLDLAFVLSGWGVCPGPTWATVLEWAPDAAVVTDANLRAAIMSSGFAWRVRDNAANIEMLLVPAGTFTMGCSASAQYACSSIESPTHQVTLAGPPQIWWTLRIGEFDLARRSVSHGHDASIHTRVSSVCRQSCSC